MPSVAQDITQQLHTEIDAIPAAYQGLLLRLVHSFREGIEADFSWPTAADAFREGWQDRLADRTHSVETLWDGIEGQEDR